MKWRTFADRELPRVIRDLKIPCALPTHDTAMTRCPRHDEPVGPITRMCLRCHNEAWAEVGRRFTAHGRLAERGGHDSARAGQIRKPLAGQQSLLEKETTNEEETMNTSTEPVQAELLPALIEEPASAPITLFGTSDPKVALEKMSEVASVLVDVIKDRKLFVRISGHEHITAEGWTTLGGMLGIVPVVAWTKPNETGDGYLARVEARRLDGRVVGAAECECSRAERRWKTADPYAIRSMAQTRAIGRALRAPLGQIVVLAGYQAAGAEEIIDVVNAEPEPATAATAPTSDPIPDAIKPTDDQKAQLHRLLDELADERPDEDWTARASEIAGVPGKMLTATTMDILLRELEKELERLGGEPQEIGKGLTAGVGS